MIFCYGCNMRIYRSKDTDFSRKTNFSHFFFFGGEKIKAKIPKIIAIIIPTGPKRITSKANKIIKHPVLIT